MEDESLYPRAENMITGYLNQCSAQEANTDPAILGVYAVLLEKKGDFSGAKLIYEKAKAAGESTSTRLYNHALLLESPPFNDYNGAKTLYLEALTIDERDARVMFSLGDLYETLGEPKNAEKQYQKAIEVDPNSHNAKNNLARLLLERAKASGNVSHANEAIGLLEQLPPTLKIYGASPISIAESIAFAKQLRGRMVADLSSCAAPCGCASATHHCGKCKVRKYCSKECQTSDWKIHRGACRDPQLSSRVSPGGRPSAALWLVVL